MTLSFSEYVCESVLLGADPDAVDTPRLARAKLDLRDALLAFSGECFAPLPSEGARRVLLHAATPYLMREGRTWGASMAHVSSVAELLERAVERWDMLEAIARLVGHVREARGEDGGPMELGELYQSEALSSMLFGLATR